uniref:Uncharacterized protein n=1 Tax=Ciona intestinalis TaxID=7719 RepID=H2XL92_CIOIN
MVELVFLTFISTYDVEVALRSSKFNVVELVPPVTVVATIVPLPSQKSKPEIPTFMPKAIK